MSREKLLELHLALDKAAHWVQTAKGLLEGVLEEVPGATLAHAEEAADILGAVAERNAARREAPLKVPVREDDQDDTGPG